jgi:hypothetical protein
MRLLTENHRLVARVAALTCTHTARVNRDANEATGIESVKQATPPQLRTRAAELRRWLSLIDEW